jgi:hypothetical protein
VFFVHFDVACRTPSFFHFDVACRTPASGRQTDGMPEPSSVQTTLNVRVQIPTSMLCAAASMLFSKSSRTACSRETMQTPAVSRAIDLSSSRRII